MKKIKDELDDLEVSVIAISNHIKELRESSPSIFSCQFYDFERHVDSLKKIIGELRKSFLLPGERNNKGFSEKIIL